MGKFIINPTDTGFRFLLKAGNGETVAASEVYTSAALCRKGIASVCKCAENAKVADLTRQEKAGNPCFEIYMDRAGKYRFRLKARNGKVIAVSEGYTTGSACENGIQALRRSACCAPVEISD